MVCGKKKINDFLLRFIVNDSNYFLFSDDDEFYDRTKKTSSKKAGENQSIETADTLLDKRDAITKEMENKKELLSIEKSRMALETAEDTDAGDALDTYMSGLSSKLGAELCFNVPLSLICPS